MRALFGLVALAATVQAQSTSVTLAGSGSGSFSNAPGVGQTALAAIDVFQQNASGARPTVTPSLKLGGAVENSGNYAIYVQYKIDAVTFIFTTNNLTAQMQYRWAPNYPSPAAAYPTSNLSSQSYTCDTCAGGTPITCNTSTGPGAAPSPSAGFACASLQRTYNLINLQPSLPNAQATINSLSVQLLDRQTNPGPNTSSYSFTVIRNPPDIKGDPQIIGLQGQDFQVHGVPDEIFNMITYPNLQVNARFVYLSNGECIDNYTACFAHPGTYISEEGIRLGSDKIHVRAGAAKKGLTVSVNGKKLATGKQTVKLGAVEIVNHRRVVITTPIMSISLTNSDKFLNQESSLFDRKLLALGAERRVLKDGKKFHSEVPLHGLQGQTWRNVEYPSGLEYEGSISDYQIQDGNLYGTNFVFNQYQA